MSKKEYNLRAGYYHNYTGICSDSDENLTTNEVVDLLNEKDEQIKELVKDLSDALNRIEERSIDIQLLKEANENFKKEKEELQSKAKTLLDFYSKRYDDAIFNGQRNRKPLCDELWMVKEILSELGLYEDE